MSLVINNLSCGYDGKSIVDDISMSVGRGDVICVLGANGVGKTTFFKTVQGFLKPISGSITFDGKPLQDWNRAQLAKHIAYVPQSQSPAFSYKVSDVVVMGRTAHLGLLKSPAKKDYLICEEILDSLGVRYLWHKDFSKISGGERQLVLIARALAQEPKLLMMDEPTSNLDFGNQITVLQQVVNMAKDDIGIIMTTHTPDHVFLCATRVALFEKNHHMIYGDVDEVMTEDAMRLAYGVHVDISSICNSDGQYIRTCVPRMYA